MPGADVCPGCYFSLGDCSYRCRDVCGHLAAVLVEAVLEHARIERGQPYRIGRTHTQTQQVNGPE